MFRKTVAVGKKENGVIVTTESYYFLSVLLYRRDVLLVLP